MRSMDGPRIAGSIDELVAGASTRTPVTTVDGKSGAQFERAGHRRRALLPQGAVRRRRLDHALHRQHHELGVPRLGGRAVPPGSGGHRPHRRGDVAGGRWSGGPPGDPDDRPQRRPRAAGRRRRCRWSSTIGSSSTWRRSTPRFFGWHDTIGLQDLARRFVWFAPATIAAGAARRRRARTDRRRRDRVAAAARPQPAAVRPRQQHPRRPARPRRGAGRRRRRPSSPATGSSATSDPVPTAARSCSTGRTRARRRRVGSWPGTWPSTAIGCRAPRRTTIAAYRRGLEDHGVDTAAWWDRQLGLCMVGMMATMAWEKALGDDERAAVVGARRPRRLAATCDRDGGRPARGAYAGAGPGWAADASLVYRAAGPAPRGPQPDPARRPLVLDAGAGTGAAGSVLADLGARVVESDIEPTMLEPRTGGPAGGRRRRRRRASVPVRRVRCGRRRLRAQPRRRPGGRSRRTGPRHPAWRARARLDVRRVALGGEGGVRRRWPHGTVGAHPAWHDVVSARAAAFSTIAQVRAAARRRRARRRGRRRGGGRCRRRRRRVDRSLPVGHAAVRRLARRARRRRRGARMVADAIVGDRGPRRAVSSAA